MQIIMWYTASEEYKLCNIVLFEFRDCRQITFVTLNGFCPLSEPALFLTGKIKMDERPTKINWKIHTIFTLYLKFWRYFL